MRRIIIIVAGLLIFNPLVPAGEVLTYIDLVEQLYDLERLAMLPEPGEQCAQWSSYNRESYYDQTKGKYIGWDTNKDGDSYIREENGQFVIAEMEGPGVIWRIWSARAEQGHVKIYLDGQSEPAVDLPFIGYFNLENKPFTYPTLVHRTARGLNCYVPIPYQKSCKIVADKGWGRFYHFTYSTFPKNTILPTFRQQLSPAESIALDRANKVLSNCSIDPAGRRGGEITEQKSITIAPKSTAKVIQLEGTRAITAIKVKMQLPESPKDRDILRELTLSINWDGENQPSVWSPLGDFFGTAPGVNHYKSLPLGMTEDGFYCYWYMPFEKEAMVKLTNDGNKERTVEFTITHAPVSRPIEQLGRFHAKWHRDAFLPLEPERRAIDWTMLKTEGCGRYCGVVLNIWNPKGNWWGEGDEKFFVDGEKFPSTFGTGSEDYFGYAWGDPTLFSNCYHNQTISMHNRGHISVNRWHIVDNVPFQCSFDGAIEKYFPNDRPTLYDAVAYWYQAAGQADRYQQVPLEERLGHWTGQTSHQVKGAIEGEDLEILEKTGGKAAYIQMDKYGDDWSCDGEVLWYNNNPGDTMDLALPVTKTGKYHLKIQHTKAFDFGIVQLYLDGMKLGEPIDLYDEKITLADMLDAGVHKLTKGMHILRVEVVGANPKAKESYRYAIDYLLLEEVK